MLILLLMCGSDQRPHASREHPLQVRFAHVLEHLTLSGPDT